MWREALYLRIGVGCHQALTDNENDGKLKTVRDYLSFLRDYRGIGPASSYVDTTSTEVTWPHVSTDEGISWSAKEWLSHTMNTHPRALKGVSPYLYDDAKYGPQGGYAFLHLINALWLQLYLAILKSSPIRECRGCQILFQAERDNQMYHDTLCRGQTNARNTYMRRKGREEL